MFNPYQSQIDSLKQQLQETELLLQDPELSLLAQEDFTRITEELKSLEQAALEYEQQVSSSGESSNTTEHINCTMEIRGGVGGDEGKIWAADLIRMYTRFCELHKIKVEFLDEMVIKIKGKTTLSPNPYPDSPTITVYELFKYESGVHRVQRVPATESQGRVHTSTATIVVLPEVPPTAIEIRPEDLEWQFIRASGAGGQHVNKTSSAVRLVHKPSGMMTTSQQEKKQDQNRKIALELLRAMLWEEQEEKRLAELGEARSVIGKARRAEKIRTYNFPQNRVTDHRTKQSWYSLDSLVEGNLEGMLSELHTAFATPDGELEADQTLEDQDSSTEPNQD